MRRLMILLVIGIGATVLVTGCQARIGHPYTVTSDPNGTCMALNPLGDPLGDGTSVVQWDCNYYHMQLQDAWYWYLIGQDANKNNLYKVVSIQSGKCMEVSLANGGKDNGAVVQQAKCSGADNQQWLYNTIVSKTPGNVYITSKLSGKCIQVALDSSGEIQTQDGAAIEQWDCTMNATNQLWIMKETNDPTPPYDTGKGELCDACNPANPNCAAGAKCIVLTTGQSVCGKTCSATAACPYGYTCTPIKTTSGTIQQCVPEKNSCP